MKKEFDPKNDIVLTPAYVADLMSALAGVGPGSTVADNAAGDGALLLSAARRGATNLRGVEYEGIMYDRLLRNFAAAGLDDSGILHGDGMADSLDFSGVTALLSNPPYSADGRGFCFAERVMRQMNSGRAVVLIQENAGSGRGLPHTNNILKHSTLRMSIKMADIFKGFASVQVGIYVFQCGRPHDPDDIVKFIDMSDDGYVRSGRKSSRGEVKPKDDPEGRYTEVLDRFLGRDLQTHYYDDCYIEDKITLNGDDWTYDKHRVIDTIPTEEDFKRTVADYMEYKAKSVLTSGGINLDHPYLAAAILMGINVMDHKNK